jgi:hypothetical protein
VLSVNYRGSTGFGKAFVAASEREHARKMHDDLLDMVEWAVGQGIAQRYKIAIFGVSYGGYARLFVRFFLVQTLVDAGQRGGSPGAAAAYRHARQGWFPRDGETPDERKAATATAESAKRGTTRAGGRRRARPSCAERRMARR